MANPNVRKRLDNISDELDMLVKHVVQHSGVSEKDALAIDNRCADIVEQAARIGAEARLRQNNRSGETLVRDVRRALGYTNP
jgi:hypothetical protein